MIIKGQLNGKKLGAKEAYYLDDQILAAFEDFDTAKVEVFSLVNGKETFVKAFDNKQDALSFAKAISKNNGDGQYIVKENGEEIASYYWGEKAANEDTVKQGNKWVNKGKEGTHGSFKTKKEAAAQRKAMFANGYESYEDGLSDLDWLKRAATTDPTEIDLSEIQEYYGDDAYIYDGELLMGDQGWDAMIRHNGRVIGYMGDGVFVYRPDMTDDEIEDVLEEGYYGINGEILEDCPEDPNAKAVIRIGEENFEDSAEEAAACENADQVSNFYLMLDNATDDTDLDNITNELESVKENGELTDDEYNQILIEIQNRR